MGRGLVRGRWVVGGGSWARGPSGEERVGRLKSAPRSSWMPSRAVDWRYDSRSWLGFFLVMVKYVELGEYEKRTYS